MTEPRGDPENAEECAGDEIPNPWDDPDQPDWPEPDAGGIATLAASWVVVPSLNQLLKEINAIAPNRDKASDGSIGDTSHSARPSGHNPDESGSPEDTDSDRINEVRARDFDKDLRRPGLTMEMIAQYLVQQARAGRITWIKYIIYNRRIWSASSGWVTRTYTGSNPHDKHMHVSSKADTASENNTRPVGLDTLVEEPGMELNDKVGSKVYPSRTVKDFFADWWVVRDTLVNDPKGKINPSASSPFGQLVAMIRDYPRLKEEVAALTVAVSKISDPPPVRSAPSEQEVTAVLAALSAGSPEESAARLRALLGDQSAAVGRLLADG